MLFAHGAVTAGGSLSESVMAMAELEEQARMNYLAYSAHGPGYPRVADGLIDEMTNRTPLYELPHFKEVLQGKQPQRAGIWNYRVVSVSQDL